MPAFLGDEFGYVKEARHFKIPWDENQTSFHGRAAEILGIRKSE